MNGQLGIDARMFGYSGIGTYIRGLIAHFPDDIKKDILLFGDKVALGRYGYNTISSSQKIYSLREQFFLPSFYKRYNLETLHVPHYNIPIGYRGKIMATIHDIIHILFPQFLPNRLAYLYAKTMIKAALKKSSVIIVDSINTKKDILSKFSCDENKIKVISLGIDDQFNNFLSREKKDAIKLKYGLPEKYFLYVGNIRLSKNIPRLLQAYRILKKKHPHAYPLVLVGKKSMPKQYWNIINNKDIICKEGVSWEDLPGIYQGGYAFVFPSLYEGFGLPPLEAMASCLPVISSNAGSLPEVLGDAAIMVHPYDIQGLADSMARVLEDDDYRKEFIQKGIRQSQKFNWQKTVQKHCDIYKEVM